MKLGRQESMYWSSTDPIEQALGQIDAIIEKLPPLPKRWSVGLMSGETVLPVEPVPVAWEKVEEGRWQNAETLDFGKMPSAATITSMLIVDSNGTALFSTRLQRDAVVGIGDSLQVAAGGLTLDWPFSIPPGS